MGFVHVQYFIAKTFNSQVGQFWIQEIIRFIIIKDFFRGQGHYYVWLQAVRERGKRIGIGFGIFNNTVLRRGYVDLQVRFSLLDVYFYFDAEFGKANAHALLFRINGGGCHE